MSHIRAGEHEPYKVQASMSHIRAGEHDPYKVQASMSHVRCRRAGEHEPYKVHEWRNVSREKKENAHMFVYVCSS